MSEWCFMRSSVRGSGHPCSKKPSNHLGKCKLDMAKKESHVQFALASIKITPP